MSAVRKTFVRVLSSSLTTMLAAVLLPASAALASAQLETFVSIVSYPGDFIGDGKDRYFFPGNAEITIEGDASDVRVSVDGGNLGEDFSLTFTAPAGEVLRPGEYDHAQRSPFASAPRPGMNVSGNGHGCNQLTGRYRVKSIATGAGGAVTSLWVIFEQHCEGGSTAPLIGEVRYAVPGDGGLAIVGPREIRWPDADRAQNTLKVVPVTVVNPGDVPIGLGSSFVEGPSRSDFNVRIDDCEGVTLGAGEACSVWIRYVPQEAGQRTATLVVPETAGPLHSVALEGFAFGGTTRFVVTGDPGDPVAGPNYYDFSPHNSRMVVTGDHEGVSAWISTSRGEWTAEFDPPAGDILAPGQTYVDDDETGFSEGPAARLQVNGNDTGCTVVGRFTVSEIAVNDFGELERFGVSFEQHCVGTFPGMHGIVDFRVEQPNDPPARFPSYRRKVSLSLGKGVVSGRVAVVKGPRVCIARVQVAIVVLKGDRVRLVAVARTDASGRYRRRVQKLDGVYQAFVPLKQLGDGSICRDALSPVRATGG